MIWKANVPKKKLNRTEIKALITRIIFRVIERYYLVIGDPMQRSLSLSVFRPIHVLCILLGSLTLSLSEMQSLQTLSPSLSLTQTQLHSHTHSCSTRLSSTQTQTLPHPPNDTHTHTLKLQLVLVLVTRSHSFSHSQIPYRKFVRIITVRY